MMRKKKMSEKSIGAAVEVMNMKPAGKNKGERMSGGEGSIGLKIAIWIILLSVLPLGALLVFINPLWNKAFISVSGEYVHDQAMTLGSEIQFLESDAEIRQVLMVNADGRHFAFLADKEGNYLLHPDEAKKYSSMKNDFSSSTVANILGNQNGIVLDDAASALMGYASVPGRDAIAVVVMNQSMLLDDINVTESSAFILLVISMALLAMLCGVMMWSLFKPIHVLVEITKKVSDGDFSIKIDDSEFEGELATLASSFNKMIHDLKSTSEKLQQHQLDLEGQVSQRTKELSSRIKDLTDTRTAILNILEDVNASKGDLEKSHTDLVRLNADMEKANVELKKSEDYKNQFISITAHELKTPLASIHGFAGLLQNKKILSNHKQRNYYLNIIIDDADRLKRLIDDILDLSRLDLGTMKFIFEKVDLREAFKNTMKEMYVLASKNSLSLKMDVAKDVPDIITDKSRLAQILVNLVNNAIKYTPKKGGKIHVYAERKGKMIVFSVKDTGIGIPKSAYPKLFQRFFQVDSWLTRKVGGSGLGLSISKGIVEAMGGKMWFKSQVNKGSTFFFVLPIKSKMTVASEQDIPVIAQTGNTRSQDSGEKIPGKKEQPEQKQEQETQKAQGTQKIKQAVKHKKM